MHYNCYIMLITVFKVSLLLKFESLSLYLLKIKFHQTIEIKVEYQYSFSSLTITAHVNTMSVFVRNMIVVLVKCCLFRASHHCSVAEYYNFGLTKRPPKMASTDPVVPYKWLNVHNYYYRCGQTTRGNGYSNYRRWVASPLCCSCLCYVSIRDREFRTAKRTFNEKKYMYISSAANI